MASKDDKKSMASIVFHILAPFLAVGADMTIFYHRDLKAELSGGLVEWLWGAISQEHCADLFVLIDCYDV